MAPYHHGRLREALVGAALASARTDGPDAVVLRAATRAVGVTPPAAYRHFATRDDLVAAVAEECMEHLGRLMEERLAVIGPPDDAERAWQRLRAAGQAYVDFALAEPGWFRTAFGGVHGAPDPAKDTEGPNPFAILNTTLDDLVRTGALPAQRRPGAELAAWAAVHGTAGLLVDGPLRTLAAPERQAMVAKVLDVVASGL